MTRVPRLRLVSDVHLGVESQGAIPQRHLLLIELIQQLQEGDTLILGGDLFEFWMEYRHFIPKAHFALLRALRQTVDRGIEIHYIAGNHDFDLGQFFAQEIGLHVHAQGSMDFEFGARKIHIGHGDGWAPSDWKYRILRRIIRHPFNGFLFRLLHPDWGMTLANWVGNRSRKYGQNTRIPLPEYMDYAQALLNQGYDAVLHGHIHQVQLYQFPQGLYGSSGRWLDRLNWIDVKDSGIEIWDWDQGMIQSQIWPKPQSDPQK